MDQSSGYLPKVMELLNKIETEQYDNIRAAAKLMADAIENDRLINVYGGGGHTTLPVGEMFFRAGGLCNINPCMETGLSVFNQAQKYLALERCVNYGRAIMEYYNLQKDDVLIVYHNIGTNAATIDAVMQAKERGRRSSLFPPPTGRKTSLWIMSCVTRPIRTCSISPTSASTTITPWATPWSSWRASIPQSALFPT